MIPLIINYNYFILTIFVQEFYELTEKYSFFEEIIRILLEFFLNIVKSIIGVSLHLYAEIINKLTRCYRTLVQEDVIFYSVNGGSFDDINIHNEMK